VEELEVDDFVQLNMLVEIGAPDVLAKLKSGYGRNDWKPHDRELDE
jgi:hypothetical protein